MTPQPLLVVCALDAGCPTRDGTVQPKGTAFDRVVTNPDGSDYGLPPGCALVKDEGQPLYVQNSGGPVAGRRYPKFPNDTMARGAGLQDGDFYNNTFTGFHQLGD